MAIKITTDVSIDDCSNTIIYQNKNHSITEKEKRLLCALLKHARNGNILNNEVLIKCVWPEREQAIADTNIKQLVYRLRCSLRKCGLENTIKTVHRHGYKFIIPEPLIQIQPETPPNTKKTTHKGLTKKSIYYWMLIQLIVLTLIVITLIYTVPKLFTLEPQGGRFHGQSIASAAWQEFVQRVVLLSY